MERLRTILGPEAQTRRACSLTPSFAVGVLFVAVVLAFQPFGLDQFSLPKIMVLLVGTPIVVGLVLAARVAMNGDAVLIGLVIGFFAWSMSVPLLHTRNRFIHGIGALELLTMLVLFFGTIGYRAAGPRSALWFLRLLAIPALIIAPLAVAQGLGIDPLRAVFDLVSSRPGRWQVLTTLGNPTWTAEYLVLSFPLLLAAWKPRENWAGPWLVLAGVVFTAAISVTGSRGGFIGLVVAVGFSWRLGLLSRVFRVRWMVLVAAISVIVFVTVVGIPRIGDIKPLTGRLGLWMAGAHLVGQEPLTGAGLRHTNLILAEGLESAVAGLEPIHHRWLPTVMVDRFDQDLLQVAVERGVPAAIFLIFVWVRAMVVSLKRFKLDGEAKDAAVISILALVGLFSLFSGPLHTPTTAALFWIVIGIAASGSGRNSLIEKRTKSSLTLCSVFVGTGLAVVVGVAVAWPSLNSNATAGLGHRQLIDGHFRETAETLRPVVYQSPWLPGASIDRSRALVATGKAAEALVLLADVERWTHSQWIWATRARALQQLNLRQQARRELEMGFGVLPRSPVLLEAWAEIGFEERPGSS